MTAAGNTPTARAAAAKTAAEDGLRRRWAPGTLTGDAARWRRAHRAWQQAMERRDRHVARAERRLLAATRGLGYRRWAAACTRKRIYTIAEGLMNARAIRDQPAVEAAHAVLHQARTDGDAAVHTARIELADTSKALLRHGPAGAQAAGISEAELRRLARRPRRAGRQLAAPDDPAISGAAAGKREQASYSYGRMPA
jgi:hypothetical protein